jgi:hypothetical protein
MLNALVCERTADIYGEYICGAYAERKKFKAELKSAEDAGDLVKAMLADLAQEIEKLKMNCTYGKLGWAKYHDVSNYITFDTKFLLE